MASFTVSFNANGSAFDDGYDGRAEIEAILRTLADRYVDLEKGAINAKG